MYKNSKFTIVLPIVVAVSIVVGILLGSVISRRETPAFASRSALRGDRDKLHQLFSLIRTRYVDTVSLDSLSEKVIPLVLEELDPHSTYLSLKDLQRANETIEGEFEGIGVMFNMSTDTVVVLNVIHGGPSARAGIQAGDRIVTVNDSVVAGVKMNQDSVVRQLRGPRGSKVKLGIRRSEIRDLVPIVVTRDVIPINSISAAYMIRPGVGYVKFEQFSVNAHREMTEAISRLKAEGMQKLILDIRGNTGGLLDQAILISNEFLPAHKMIVYTQDREGNRETEYSNGNGTFTQEELVVLIDENSASASEILAGALQDNDRGTIVGRRSFGKGLVQTQLPFSDGSAVRLTVARYYTPSGRSIQKPYSKGHRGEYEQEVASRYEHNEMFSADSVHFADSLQFKTVSGRVVYGGGGIMPDIFVPIDTTDLTPYFREVVGRNVLYKFTLEYSDRHRKALNAVRSLADLDAFFARQTGLLDEFVAYAAKAGVQPKPADLARSKAVILAQLKAYIGRNTELEDIAFYHNIQAIDKVVDRSIQVLQEGGDAGATQTPTPAPTK